ncbi:MAG: hypothetical protein OSB61_11640, partial [Verrucomicrobiota bacterium]|nr:hypothetical protein [Verrucomicrobiota bacterium]
IGEFGSQAKDKTLEEERRQFEFLLNLIVTNQVPLPTLWNFDFEHVDQPPFSPLRSPQQRPQGHPAKRKFLAANTK